MGAGGSRSKVRGFRPRREEAIKGSEGSKGEEPLTAKQESLVKQGYDKTGIVEGKGGYGLPAPLKKGISKEDKAKIEQEAEDRVNKRLSERDQSKKEQKEYFERRANKGKGEKKKTKFFNVSSPMYKRK